MEPSAVDGHWAVAAAFVAAAAALPTARPAASAAAAGWTGRRPAAVPAAARGGGARRISPPPISAKKQPPSSRAKRAASAASPPPSSPAPAAAASPPSVPTAAPDSAAAGSADGTPTASSSSSSPTAHLAARLLELTRSVNCGYNFIEGSPAPIEYDIDDVVAALEAAAEASPPDASSPHLVGTWRLVYTTSPAVRYVGGLTGAHSLLPGGGRSLSVVRVVDEPDEPTCMMMEELAWTPPWGRDNAAERPLTVSVTGSLRRGGSGWDGTGGAGSSRMVWTPERLALGWLRPWGDSWKSLRPWTVMDVSWVGEGVQVSRGQTGYVFVWEKVEA
ncbi:hypothetical protein MMPV_001921 [Pyropia vietnamensis]